MDKEYKYSHRQYCDVAESQHECKCGGNDFGYAVESQETIEVTQQ
jgi:hypothetical protein